MVKIPKHAKEVFAGDIFKVIQWKQKMFNARFKTFEFAQRLDGVGVIATVKDKIVMLYQKQPGTKWYYTVPGGYLDVPEETPKQGILRELLEETDLKPKKLKLWKTYHGRSRVISKYHIFIAQDCEKVAKQDLDGGEIIEVKLVNFEQFLKFSDNPKFHNHDLLIEMLQARLHPKRKAEFKKLIFGR